MQYKTMNQHNCALILNGTLLWIEELYLYDKEPQMRIFYIKIVPSLNPIVVSCDIWRCYILNWNFVFHWKFTWSKLNNKKSHRQNQAIIRIHIINKFLHLKYFIISGTFHQLVLKWTGKRVNRLIWDRNKLNSMHILCYNDFVPDLITFLQVS